MTACGENIPCLTNAKRGVDGTTTDNHSLGETVFQNQCSLAAQGAVPNFQQFIGKRSLLEAYYYQPSMWAVGKSGHLFHYDVVWQQKQAFTKTIKKIKQDLSFTPTRSGSKKSKVRKLKEDEELILFSGVEFR